MKLSINHLASAYQKYWYKKLKYNFKLEPISYWQKSSFLGGKPGKAAIDYLNHWLWKERDHEHLSFLPELK